RRDRLESHGEQAASSRSGEGSRVSRSCPHATDRAEVGARSSGTIPYSFWRLSQIEHAREVARKIEHERFARTRRHGHNVLGSALTRQPPIRHQKRARILTGPGCVIEGMDTATGFDAKGKVEPRYLAFLEAI